MDDFKKIEYDFYISKYGLPKMGNPDEIWNEIKLNKELLKWSIKPVKDKFRERDIVNGLSICDSILANYNEIDKSIYMELVNLIYSNKDIARIVLDGYNNGGYSYLLMTLWNPNLKLTKAQKSFAVDEAMNKINTTRYKNDMYTTSLLRTLSVTQAHGLDYFDIRYLIFKNNNWSLEEKKQLIMDFWLNDEIYYKTLEEWEWSIVNDLANYKGNPLPLLDIDKLYEYTYNELLYFYSNKEITNRIWNEIQFCREMNNLRPKQRKLYI